MKTIGTIANNVANKEEDNTNSKNSKEDTKKEKTSNNDTNNFLRKLATSKEEEFKQRLQRERKRKKARVMLEVKPNTHPYIYIPGIYIPVGIYTAVHVYISTVHVTKKSFFF